MSYYGISAKNKLLTAIPKLTQHLSQLKSYITGSRQLFLHERDLRISIEEVPINIRGPFHLRLT